MGHLAQAPRHVFNIVMITAFIAGCGTHYQTAADSLMSEECRGLASLIEQREAFGIVAASQEADEAALQRCRFPSRGAWPPIKTPPYNSAAGPVLEKAPPNQSRDEVTIERHGDTYTVPVRLNQTITLPFVLDTGASVLMIPADVALTLRRAGALTNNDFIGPSRYSMANGSEQVSDRVIIREVQVGDHVVRNVTALVSPPAGDPLLGQSFLSEFGAVTIDYNRLVLVLSH